MSAAEAVVEDLPRARGLPKAVQCEASTKSVPVLDRGFDESPHRHHHGAPGPQGNLAVGDVMLAQKIALETIEVEALAKANRNRTFGAAPSRSAPQP
jgi:hypothetical protein